MANEGCEVRSFFASDDKGSYYRLSAATAVVLKSKSIPPEEMYHIQLDEWGNLAQVSDKALLCYLPVKRESLKTEHDENQTD